MTDQERIDKALELIEKYIYNSDVFDAESCFMGDFQEFKSSMLQLLLPWRDFDKERPKFYGDWIIIYNPKPEDEMNGFFYGKYIPNKDDYTNAKYWLYKEELEDTLPKEDK